MVFLNDNTFAALASHNIISRKVAAAITDELTNGPFTTYETTNSIKPCK